MASSFSSAWKWSLAASGEFVALVGEVRRAEGGAVGERGGGGVPGEEQVGQGHEVEHLGVVVGEVEVRLSAVVGWGSRRIWERRKRVGRAVPQPSSRMFLPERLEDQWRKGRRRGWWREGVERLDEVQGAFPRLEAAFVDARYQVGSAST